CVPGHRVRDPGPVRHRPRSLSRLCPIRPRAHPDPLDHHGVQRRTDRATECPRLRTRAHRREISPGVSRYRGAARRPRLPGVPCVRPNALDTERRRAIGNYAAAHEGMDIVLVGLEQLALYVDLRSWLPFVKDSLDIASLHGCRLFLTVAPEALSPLELAVLARRFDTGLSPSMFKGSAPSGPTTAAPENRIPYREPSA